MIFMYFKLEIDLHTAKIQFLLILKAMSMLYGFCNLLLRPECVFVDMQQIIHPLYIECNEFDS